MIEFTAEDLISEMRNSVIEHLQKRGPNTFYPISKNQAMLLGRHMLTLNYVQGDVEKRGHYRLMATTGEIPPGETFMGVPLVSTAAETDPTGRAANESGAKLDAGKNRLSMVLGGFSRALQEVGKVGTYGATKYSDNGWMKVPDGKARYSDALLRHLMTEAAGEQDDRDTGLRHAAHAAWNALARLELMLREGVR